MLGWLSDWCRLIRNTRANGPFVICRVRPVVVEINLLGVRMRGKPAVCGVSYASRHTPDALPLSPDLGVCDLN